MAIEGSDKLQVQLEQLAPKMLEQVRRIFQAESAALAGHIREEHMTGGTTATKLRVRSGRLRASVRAVQSQIVGEQVKGGVSFGTVYGRVHAGPKGQETIIKPKTRKFLAIPLDAAMTKAGVSRGGPMSGTWGETFIQKTDKGKLIIFGKRVIGKGPGVGSTRGQIVPLFLLVKQVKVPSRVHPEQILAWEKPRMLKAFDGVGVKLK